MSIFLEIQFLSGVTKKSKRPSNPASAKSLRYIYLFRQLLFLVYNKTYMLLPIPTLILLSSLLGTCVPSAVKERRNLTLTIYESMAMIKDIRAIVLDPAYSTLVFDDVASTIQTETVTFRPTSKNISVAVLQQNYENNLISKSALLKKFINQKVTVEVEAGQQVRTISGVLMANSPAFLLKTTSSGIISLDAVSAVHLPELPSDFFTVPNLVWKVVSPFPNQITADFTVAYRATGFSWKADYILTLNPKTTQISLNGWVTIDNYSGKKYDGARVKLIAGDVNTVTNNQPQYMYDKVADEEEAEDDAGDVEEKSFADYHMYTLQRPVSLDPASKKQVEFIPTIQGIKVRKYIEFKLSTGGNSESLSGFSKIEFNNTKSNRLGMALPRGSIRVFMEDEADKELQFIGQDSIDHTPRDENLTVSYGQAFDVVAQKTVEEKQQFFGGGYRAKLRLRISNHKERNVFVKLTITNEHGDNLVIDWKGKTRLVKKSSSQYEVFFAVRAGKTGILRWSESLENWA